MTGDEFVWPESMQAHQPIRGIRDNADHCACGWRGPRGVFAVHQASRLHYALNGENVPATIKPAYIDPQIGLPICIVYEDGHRVIGRLASITHDQDGTRLTITEEP